MSCPNITSPEWKSLVSAIGVENAWREFFKYGEIPNVSIYDVKTEGKKVLYSIKTKTTEELAKGINKDLIKSQKEIKYTSFIQALVLNKIGDLTPNKVLKVTPAEAFASAKSNFETSLKNVNNFIAFIKTAEKFNSLKEKDPVRFDKILAGYWLQNISSFEEAVQAGANYKEIVDNFKKYESYVIADLLSKGLKISKSKNKIDAIDPQDKEDQNQDNTEDNSLPNTEINPQKFDATIFEVNPYDTATVRVRALVQTIKTGKYEMGIPLYADPNDVMDDILYAGVSMNLSGFNDKDSKFEKFKQALQEREEGRPYIKELLAKIEKAEQKGDWAIINQILTFASKAFANEELLLYTLRKTGNEINGVTGVKIIGGNRDTVIDQIKRDWISKQQTSNFYNKAANGDLTPKVEKVELLNKIREEGKLATGDTQKKKFIEYFKVLGIEFTMDDLKVITPKVNKLFRKNFSVLFDKNSLLDNIYNSFKKNLNVPFEGQYGFQDEGREMGYLAQLYFDATPNVYKAGSTKTADGKTKYLYIQTNNAEISKREFQNTDGTSVTNTALAQPNNGENGFWRKVKQNISKFVLGYFNGSREQEAGKEGKVRKNFTEKEQIVNMLLGHQANMKEGNYITFTLSDKTTSMETKMTKEFFVDDVKIPVGSDGKDYSITKDGEIKYTDTFKDRVYNSFVEPEISRILSAMKYESSVNLKNFNIASKLFYFFPRLNADPSLENFRKDLYSGKFTIDELNTKYSKAVADVIIDEFTLSSEDSINKFKDNGIIKVDKKGNYKFPLYDIAYVNRFKEVNTTGKNLAMLMSMDMKLNYMNSQIKTIQFLKFDPMHAFKAFAGFKGGTFDSISNEDKVKLANSTWDEFSKRAAALIAPGSQGNWTWKYDGNKKTYGAKQTYRTVTLKDVEKGNQFSNKKFETTDAQEFVTMQEHIDYLMSEGRIPLDVWESIHNKIKKEGPGGYYELTKEELGYVLTPMKPVYAGSSKEGPTEAGLNRFDYVKSSRFPLIPQHEVGSERDKLRIWMEKNNIQSANFASAKKLGKPSLSVEVFDKDNNFIEPVDFEKGLQELSRDGLRNQQEIPHQKDEIATVSQMNRTLFDGLLESRFNFSGLENVSGTEMKAIKETIRAKMFDNAAEKLKEKIGDLHRSNKGLYDMLEKTILEDTTGSYTKNDLRSLKLNDQGMFEIPLEVQFKFPKFQALINSMINKNVMLKVEGTSFVQVSGVGAKFNFKDLSKGVKSDIVWTDKFAKTFKDGEANLKYISKDKQGNVQPAQVLVSQYLRDEKGELINLKDFITEKNGVKILDTSRFSPEMLQLVASRIPNQSHVSMLPIEVVGFLPSYMENTIVVPDGITGQMGSDFDVDKLFAYTSKIVKSKNKKDEVTYGPIEYTINSISDISKLNSDQLSQIYRDIHWNVLTHEDTFDKITKSVDMDEVKDKIELREKQLEKYGITIDEGANLPLDYETSINRFIDNKSGKDGVSIYANLISAQADIQDKPLILGKFNKETGEEEPDPVKIRLSKNGKIVDLLYVGKIGESKSFIGEKRSISDNLNIQFTESVDNAKNQFLREFGWNDKSMGAMGMLTMLTDEKGQAAPIEFMMDLSSQPSIKKLLNLIDLKQDAFATFKPDALKESIVELQDQIEKTIDNKRFLKAGEKAGIYLIDKDRDNVLDPQTLANMWLVGKAIESGSDAAVLEKIAKDLKYDSIEEMLLDYYTVQYDSLELFQRLNGLGKELMTILGSLYTYTKGIGAGVFVTKQKLNQLNKLADSENFIGIKNLAGVVEKNKETGIITIAPEGELGSSIQNSLIEAQRMYGYLFPIATGKNLESIVTSLLDGLGEKVNEVSSNRYETVFNNVFSSSIEYLYTHPDLELFEDVRATRERLINGNDSLAKRITKLKNNPEWAKNGFLKNLQIDPIWKSDIQTISFKAPFGTQIDGDAIESGFYELATYKGENEEEIRNVAKDLMLYVYATGDAGNMGSKIPIDYVMSDKEFARGIRRIRGTYNENMFKDDVRQNLIDQIVQNNPDEYSKKFSFFSSDTYESPFRAGLKSVINNADNLSNVSTFTISRGDFKEEKAQGIVDALTIPLNDAEIKQAIEDKLNPYTKDKKGKQIPKAKYPPYILITDTFQSEFDSANDRNIKYLYKRTSKALNAEGNATYERINILGIKGIKEFDADPENSGLKSIIKNNSTEPITDPEMYPDEVDMTFGLTPESFEDYSIKPGQGRVIFDIKSSRFTDETGKSIAVTRIPISENEEEESTYEAKPNVIFINNREATITKKETIDDKLYIDYEFKGAEPAEKVKLEQTIGKQATDIEVSKPIVEEVEEEAAILRRKQKVIDNIKKITKPGVKPENWVTFEFTAENNIREGYSFSGTSMEDVLSKIDAKYNQEIAALKQEPTETKEFTTVNYKGDNYITEGTIEEGDLNFYYQKNDGSKGELVKDSGLYHKLSVQHEADIHPSSVVELTDLQHSPKYLVSIEGQVYSLTPSNFGKEIESPDVIKRVYNKFNSKLEDKIVLEEKGPEVGQEKPTFSYKGITVPTEFKLSEQQTKALTDIIDFTESSTVNTGLYTGTYTLEGYAGTGKTSIIGVLERYIKEKNKYTEFIYMAPTHAATVALGLNVVKYGSRYLPMTVASAVREGKDKFGNKTMLFTKKFTDRAKGTKNVIVLDEASMLANKDFNKVVAAAQDQGYKVIFLGDPKQIPEVMSGAKTKELAKAFGNPSKSVLSTVFRTKDNNILNILTNIRNNKEFEEYNFQSTDNLKQLPRGEYNDELIKDLQNNLEDVTIINYTNDGVSKINQAARRVLGFDGELKTGEKIMGYLGSQTKQIEKGHVANSVSYMVDKVEKNEEGPVIINAHSKLLENLLQQGMSGFKNNISFTYLQLSNDDSLDFGLNDKQIDYNKNVLKEQLKRIHELNNAYLVYKTISYPAYVNSVDAIRKELANINTGAKYIYNPKTDAIELYDSKKHYGLNANLEMDKGVDFGYGITIHKSQGMTIPIVYFDTSSLGAVSDTNITRNGEKFNTEKNALYYVGMSRASQKLVVPINEVIVPSPIDSDFISDDNNNGGGVFDLTSFIAENIKQDIAETVFGLKGSEFNTKQVLNNVLKQTTPLNKQLLSLVSKTGGIGNLKIVVDEKITNPGEYDKNTKVIKINPELAISDNVEDDKQGVAQLHEVIMHELLHHITTDLLNTNPALLTIDQRKWVTSLKNLFKTTQEKLLKDSKHSNSLKEAIDVVSKEDGFLSTSDKSKYYGLTSVDEFVSMLMTDEGFRNFMNETTYEGNKSILDRFIEILSKIIEALGVQVKDNSVLKEGITNIVGLIESRNISKTSEDSAPLRSISTESAKANLIKENFESIIESLNIKTQC